MSTIEVMQLVILAVGIGYFYGRVAPIAVQQWEKDLRRRLWEWRIWHLERQIERAKLHVDEMKTHAEARG